MNATDIIAYTTADGIELCAFHAGKAMAAGLPEPGAVFATPDNLADTHVCDIDGEVLWDPVAEGVEPLEALDPTITEGNDRS